MKIIKKNQYELHYNGMVRVFDSKEDARVFMADWMEFTKQMEKAIDKMFQSFEPGRKVDMKWKDLIK